MLDDNNDSCDIKEDETDTKNGNMDNNHYFVTDKVQIIGKNKRFDNIEMIATNRFITVGSQQISYRDILKIIESVSSDRSWILLTNHGIIQIISSSSKQEID